MVPTDCTARHGESRPSDANSRRITSEYRHPVLWNYTTSSYRDNDVNSKQFLERLTIADVNIKSYRSTLLGALHVSNHLCLVAALMGTWYRWYACPTLGEVCGEGDTIGLFIFEASSFLLTIFLYYRVEFKNHGIKPIVYRCWEHIKQAAVLVLTVGVLSPVYATLTTSISPDTTLALITVLMLAHLYLYDYSTNMNGAVGKNGAQHQSPWSLMCGMCASVLASTRMQNILDVMGVTLLSLQLYIGSPYFLYGMYGVFGRVTTSLVVGGCVLAWLPLMPRIWLAALLVVVVVLCPMWMVRIVKFKSHINGPWDEMKPDLRLRDETERNVVK
jgi:hypothetical protein